MTMAADKQDKVLNVPTLRFPEFTREWVRNTIINVAPLQRGFDLPTQDIENGEYPVVYSNGILRTHKYYKCKAPGLVTGRSGSIGNFTYIPEGYYWPHNTSLWVTNFHNNDPLFIYYLYHTINISQYATGSGVPTLNRNDVHRHEVSIPLTPEQHKIAVFLSLIDKRIATQIRIIEDLKSLSDVICERLYNPSEKDSWQTYKYADLFSISNERNSKLQYTNVLSASQEYGMIERNELNIDIKFEASSIKNYKIVRPNQYVIHLRSFQGGFAYSDKTGVCSPAYTILVPNEKLSRAFLKYYFTSKRFIDSLRIVTYGIRDGRSISVEEFLQLKVAIPDVARQQHIVHVMQLWEEKIKTEESYLSKLQQQKQYLLSTMFV